MSGDWIAVQKKAFTKWANCYLRRRRLEITDVCADFKDGVKLIQLLDVISGGKLDDKEYKWKYTKHPKMELHMLENLSKAFKFMTKAGLKLTGIDGRSVYDGNEKLILGMLWMIILRFDVNIELDGLSGKEGLLLWCKQRTKGYKKHGVRVKNFGKSWIDGKAFCALIHRHRPELIDMDVVAEQDSETNCALAFKVANDVLDVPPILEVEDIADNHHPDEKIVITYIAFLFKYFASYQRIEKNLKTINNAMTIAGRHGHWINEYLAMARVLKTWMASTSESLSVRTHGSTLDEVKSTFDTYATFARKEKPGRSGDLTRLEGLLNTLNTSCRNNGRDLYVPPEEFSTDVLESEWKALETVTKNFETSLQESYVTMQKLEHTLEQFDALGGDLKKWIDVQSATFEGAEYGRGLDAVQRTADAYVTYEDQKALNTQVAEDLRRMVGEVKSGGHARADEVESTLGTLDGEMATMSAAGDAYKTGLDEAFATEVELNKVLTTFNLEVSKIAQWVDGCTGLTASGDMDSGCGVSHMRTKIATFASEYHDQSAAMSSLLASCSDFVSTLVDGNHLQAEESSSRLAELEGRVSTLNDAAAGYTTSLETAAERERKLEEAAESFGATHTRISTWAEGMSAVVTSSTDARSVAEAENKIAVFNSDYREEVPAKLDAVNTTMAELSSALVAGNHSLAGTSAEQLSSLQGVMSSLESEAASYSDALDATLQREKDLVALQKEYAGRAAALLFKSGRLAGDLSLPLLSNSVASVEADQDALGGELHSRLTALNEECGELEAKASELAAADRGDALPFEPYDNLVTAVEDANGKYTKRASDLEEALATEKHKDELREAFAGAAGSVVEYCASKSADVGSLSGDLENQLNVITGLQDEYSGHEETLNTAVSAHDEQESAGVVVNLRTPATVYTLRSMWDELAKVLKKQAESIRAQILAAKEGELTPEQYKTITDMFHLNDADKDDKLNFDEFYNATTAIGLVMDEDEVHAAYDKHEPVTFDAFTTFMTEQLTAQDTEDDVVSAFKEMADGKASMSEECLDRYFTDKKMHDFLVAHMPPVAGAEAGPPFDYTSYVPVLFETGTSVMYGADAKRVSIKMEKRPSVLGSLKKFGVAGEGVDLKVVEEAAAEASEAVAASTWEAQTDDEGSTYYWCEATGETVWELPPGAVLKSDSDLPAGWQAITDDDGNTYYHNEETGESTWDAPHA